MIDWSKKISIFNEDDLSNQFCENGYVIVDFLKDNHINELLKLYHDLHPNGVDGFYTTTFINNVKHRELVNQSIRKICTQRINELFHDYKLLFSSFIVKAPGEKSELIVHQDMTLLDESKYFGMNIWCPLVDLNDTNGAIRVLPKSHRFFKTYRGSSIPDIYDDVVDEVKSLLQPLHLKAGQAVIFDQSIIHYSPPNLSNQERPVINTFIAHKHATIKICHWDKGKHADKIEIFDQEDDFLENFENFGHNIFARPTIGKSLGYFDYDFPKLTPQMLDDVYGRSAVESKQSKKWWQSNFKLFQKS